MRTNRASKSKQFSAEVDGLKGIVVERLLCIPLTTQDGTRVIGVLHFINKSKTFSESDELFAIIFANIIAYKW